MRLVSYHTRDDAGVGVMVDNWSFVALNRAAPELPSTLKGIIEAGALGAAAAAAEGRDADYRFDQVTLDPVIPDPQAIWALALNFKTHIEETGLTTSKEFPHLFIRTPASVVGHNRPLLCPPPEVAKEFDYEGELGVVIGRGGRHIPAAKAFDHIAGFCCCNEGSVREYQRHNRNFGLGKNFERSGSTGPWLMTTDEFGDPKRQRVITRLNGIERQNAPLNDMLFPVEEVVAYLSAGYTLLPGDVIMMGTPGALPPHPGENLKPAGRHGVLGVVNMKPGDKVEVEITGLGVLKNTIAADEPRAYRPR